MKKIKIDVEELALTFVGSSSRQKDQEPALLWRSINRKAFSDSEKRTLVSSFMSGFDLPKQR